MIFLGNKAAQTTLNRMLENKTLPHTLIFCGPKGVGKGTHALRLAESLLGSSDKLLHGNHPDLHQLHPEGKGGMHPIENIRNLIRQAAYPPFEAPVKVFIIHDAHQMLASSSNALLKTLEEPIAHTYFILITNQCESILPTIVSRSRILSFFPIPDKEIEQFAIEHWQKDPQEAKRIAFLSYGSFAKAHKLAHTSQADMRTLVYALVQLSLPQEYTQLLSLCEECEKMLYCDHSNCVNFDSARQGQIEAKRSERGRPFPVGKADEEDRFGKVAASQNSHNWSGRSITPSEEAEEEKTTDQIDELLEEILAWYRDLHLLKSSSASEYLYHLDATQQLYEASRMAFPSLEEILKRILIVRTALQRHVKLRVALEHFFN